MRRFAPSVIAPAAGLALVLLVATPATGHVEPQVSTVATESLATVAFNVEHGCEGSPTVKMEFQVPDGIADAQPVDKAGWTGTLVDGIVTYTGGSLPPDQQDTFGVRFTAPSEVGVSLVFPMIQTCETGSIDWIQTGGEAQRPAPRVVVGEPDPNAPTPTATAPPTTATSTTTTTTTGPTTTEDAGPGGQEAAPETSSPQATGASASADDPMEGFYNVAPFVIVGAGAVAAAWLVSTKWRARAARTGGSGPSGT